MKSTRKFSAWILLFSIFLNQIMTGVNASNLDKKFYLQDLNTVIYLEL